MGSMGQQEKISASWELLEEIETVTLRVELMRTVWGSKKKKNLARDTRLFEYSWRDHADRTAEAKPSDRGRTSSPLAQTRCNSGEGRATRFLRVQRPVSEPEGASRTPGWGIIQDDPIQGVKGGRVCK